MFLIASVPLLRRPAARRVRLLPLLILLSAALLGGPMAQPSAASASGTYESDVIKYANVARAKQKLKPVKASSCLDGFAEKQARAMAAKKKMYHQAMGPILKACKLRLVAENVAYGYSDGKSVTDAWMHSSGHRANLLHKDVRSIGVGAYRDSRGYWYVAQVFGRSR